METSKIDLKFAQRIYDVANDEVKEILREIYPEYKLTADLSDLSNTVGRITTEKYIYTASQVKNIVNEPKPWSDTEDLRIRIELYSELKNLPDDAVLLVYWSSPSSGKPYINGFTVLKNRYRAFTPKKC